MLQREMLSDRIVLLFETHLIYLNSSIKLSDFAKILEVKESYLKQYFKDEVEYSFEEMLYIFRITHAKDLLIKDLIPYEQLWKCSGFKSLSDFEKALKKIAIHRKNL